MNTTLKTIAVLGAASLAFGAVCFDFSAGNPGTGTLTADGSWFQEDGASAWVEADHGGTWYPVGQSFEDAKSRVPGRWDSCPVGEDADCYFGWNDEDMQTGEGAAVRVTLNKYVNPEGWGYTNAGLLYLLDGAQTESANYVNIGDNITITAKLAAGAPAMVFALDANYDSNNADQGIQKAKITGNGSMQTIAIPSSQFSTWASNKYDPTKVKGIFLQYEKGATATGQAFGEVLEEMMVWQKLEVSGSCTGDEVAIGDKVAHKAVGFAALRGGLQFSNIPTGSALNVQVFNTLGKVVASHKVTSKNSFVSTESLRNGVYVVKATDGAKLNLMRNVTIMK